MDKPVCSSHIGKRPNHEDNFLIDGSYLSSDIQKRMSDKRCYFVNGASSSNIHLYAVSDGMGGHNAGEVASQICVEKLSLAYNELQHSHSRKEAVTNLQTVSAKINESVFNISYKRPEFTYMRDTLV